MESKADINPFDDSSPNGSKDENGNGSADAEGESAAKPKIKFDSEGFFYDMSGDKHLVVFNHYFYHANTGLETRNHTEKDVEALDKTFTEIGFKVEIYHDEDRETIWDILRRLRETDYSAASCLCIVILTHGCSGGILYAYDKPYYLEHVVKLFETHPTLAGKPKLFFIQACRGRNVDDGNRIETDGEPKGNVFVIPSHADFLILRSTVEDYLSWRDDRGTWMIQELCKGIRNYYNQLDILHIVTLIQREVAFAYATYSLDEECNNKRQMVQTTFTLTKFLKF